MASKKSVNKDLVFFRILKETLIELKTAGQKDATVVKFHIALEKYYEVQRENSTNVILLLGLPSFKQAMYGKQKQIPYIGFEQKRWWIEALEQMGGGAF